MKQKFKYLSNICFTVGMGSFSVPGFILYNYSINSEITDFSPLFISIAVFFGTSFFFMGYELLNIHEPENLAKQRS